MMPSSIDSGVSPLPGIFRVGYPARALDKLKPTILRCFRADDSMLQTLILQPVAGLDDLLPVAPDRPSVPAKYSVYWALAGRVVACSSGASAMGGRTSAPWLRAN